MLEYYCKSKFVDGGFAIEIKSSKHSHAKIKELYQDWLMKKGKSAFKQKVEEYSKKLGVKIEGITIKHLKNRWSSMTKQGSINLNINCHLKIKEHSHHYWDYVRRHMPNYQENIDWLKMSGNHLI